jgi:hypothetical protein
MEKSLKFERSKECPLYKAICFICDRVMLSIPVILQYRKRDKSARNSTYRDYLV